MESSAEFQQAQFALTCSICDLPSQLFCNHCHLRICENCVAQHLRSPGKHNVVAFLDRAIDGPHCESHKDIQSTYRCLTCSMCVCNECSKKSHARHDKVLVKELLDQQSRDLMKNLAELKSVIKPVFERKLDALKMKLANANKGYEVLEREISMCGDKLHREIDSVVESLKSDAKKYRDEHLTELQLEITVIENKLKDIQEAMTERENLLSKSAQLLEFDADIQHFKVIPESTNFELPVFTPGQGDVKAIFGQLSSLITSVSPSYAIKRERSKKSKRIMREPYIQASVTVGERYVYDVTCASVDSVWMCGAGVFYHDYNVRLIGKDGENKETLECPINPRYIALKSPTCVVFSDDSDKTVKLWSRDLQMILVRTGDWIPKGVDVTMSGDIIVCQFKKAEVAPVHSTLSRVVRYDENGSELRIMEYCEGKRLFKLALFVAENRNFDICVSDEGKHAVVVLDKIGKMQFVYKGNIKSGKYHSFNPRGLDTDSQGNILISDYLNYTVHIIDQHGTFLHYLMRKQLKLPLGLSVDEEDKVWVGEYSNGTISVIEYLT